MTSERSRRTTLHHLLFRGALCLVVVFLLAGCAVRTAEIRDLELLPQQPSRYLAGLDDLPMVSPARREVLRQAFLARLFSPWHAQCPLYPAKTVFWGIETFGSRRLFGENTLPRPEGWFKNLVRRSASAAYPNADQRAVTLTAVSLRLMPTHEPAFYDFGQPGEGYPFDMFQNSALPAGTPVHVSHLSEDKAWAMAEAGLTFGWVPVRDLAWVDDDFVRSFENATFITPLRDGVAVGDVDGRHLCTVDIGAVLPLVGQDEAGWTVLAAASDADGRAVARIGRVARDQARVWPAPFTRRHLSALADAMTGRPYGWGGLYQDRDCSALMRDLFAAVGLWLPRNSSQQAKEGLVFDLATLDPKAKERAILEQGIPFATLLWKSGHVMLYIGEQDGRPLVWHAAWGVKSRDPWGREGRLVIGRAAVTSLTPGLERRDVAAKDSLLATIRSMNLPAFDPQPGWP